jgi:hypothetical protein
MHLGQRFESAAHLFQKVGKVPKERFCKQDVGISDLKMHLFLEICMDFLDIFVEVRISLVPTDSTQDWHNKKGRMRVRVLNFLGYRYRISGEPPGSILYPER